VEFKTVSARMDSDLAMAWVNGKSGSLDKCDRVAY